MPTTGKVAEILDASILPHEGRQIYIGGSSLSVLKFTTYNLMQVAIVVPSSATMRDAFRCRCVTRWLVRDTDDVLKWNAALIEPTVLLSAPEDELAAIESELSADGASLHLIESGTDLLGSIIVAATRALLMRLDETDPSFRTDLSGETERLADLGVFNSTAGGDMRDVMLLSAWVAHRFAGRLGSLSSLDLLDFGSGTPADASAVVDGWVSQLFGSPSSCLALDVFPISSLYGDLMSVESNGTVADGLGESTGLAVGSDVLATCGVMSSPLEVGSRPRMLKSFEDPIPTFDQNGVRLAMTEVVDINLDTSDGAVVQVSEGADLLILEIYGASLSQSRSGADPLVGFYNEEFSEWQYTDELGNSVHTPVLNEPYYCPDLNNASVSVLRVFRTVSASAAPQPAIREIRLVLRFNGEVKESFQVKIRQQSLLGSLGGTSGMKWPTGSHAGEYGESIEKVNFVSWQPSSTSSFAIYRIETFNHTLWDVDGTDALNELALTESYGSARLLLRKFQAWREMSD